LRFWKNRKTYWNTKKFRAINRSHSSELPWDNSDTGPVVLSIYVKSVNRCQGDRLLTISLFLKAPLELMNSSTDISTPQPQVLL
jgi:hypothetical protein